VDERSRVSVVSSRGGGVRRGGGCGEGGGGCGEGGGRTAAPPRVLRLYWTRVNDGGWDERPANRPRGVSDV
jgi:hypothetical protein